MGFEKLSRASSDRASSDDPLLAGVKMASSEGMMLGYHDAGALNSGMKNTLPSQSRELLLDMAHEIPSGKVWMLVPIDPFRCRK